MPINPFELVHTLCDRCAHEPDVSVIREQRRMLRADWRWSLRELGSLVHWILSSCVLAWCLGWGMLAALAGMSVGFDAAWLAAEAFNAPPAVLDHFRGENGGPPTALPPGYGGAGGAVAPPQNLPSLPPPQERDVADFEQAGVTIRKVVSIAFTLGLFVQMVARPWRSPLLREAARRVGGVR